MRFLHKIVTIFWVPDDCTDFNYNEAVIEIRGEIQCLVFIPLTGMVSVQIIFFNTYTTRILGLYLTFVHAYFYIVHVFALITQFMMHPEIIENFEIV